MYNNNLKKNFPESSSTTEQNISQPSFLYNVNYNADDSNDSIIQIQSWLSENLNLNEITLISSQTPP